MAEVYRAIDRELKRQVAVKVLHSRFGADAQFIERFRREARAAAGLNHPNIVQVYDWGKEGDAYFLVMELLEGKSLKETINERGPLSASESISIGMQVCQALDYAHERKVIHRDIKPHNIMLSPAGNVKVTDFGIAHAQGNEGETVTHEGFLVGTAQYCSPEQAQGRPVVRGSDLYSLGIVLYEMLTQKVPFEAENPVSVAVMQVQNTPRPPREIRPDIPTALESVILKALAKSPEDRFEDAQEMSRALEASRSGVHATVPAGVIPGRGLDEQPTMIVPTQAPREAVLPTDKERTDNRRKRILIAAGIIGAVLLAALLAWLIFGQKPAAEPTTIDMPSLVGLSYDEAVRTLEQNELQVGRVQEEASEDIDEGMITRHDPEAGAQVTKGDEVDIWTSTGPAEAEIPDVSGETLTAATEILKEAGFEVGDVTRVFDEDAEKDTVISQSPAAAEKAPKGSKINMTVSDGPKPEVTVVVPSVRGLSRQQAVDKIEARGLKAAIEDEVSDSVRSGTVIRQNPDPGTSKPKGSTVTIFVSSGPAEVEVPNLQGMPESSARRQLQNLGLKVETREEESTVFDPGTVVGQSPMAGNSVAPGTTVTLVIATEPTSATTTTSTTTTTP